LARNVARIILRDAFRTVGERVRDGWRSGVLDDRSLDLGVGGAVLHGNPAGNRSVWDDIDLNLTGRTRVL
jgi:hypothetical protein